MTLTIGPAVILGLIAIYFLVLLIISYFTGKNSSNANFFLAGKKAPWLIVAFGMIGSSLSGVTFLSIPGVVGKTEGLNMAFSYLQLILGNWVGYLVVAFVLLPLYYRLNLTSIYGYLAERLGWRSYKIGAGYFLLSRMLGSSLRLFLVALVLSKFVFEPLGVPFWITVAVTILLIWLYTFKSGIKTIVWTDTLQTLFMLLAVGVTVYYVSIDLGIAGSSIFTFIAESDLSQIFFFDDWKSSDHFVKQFFSGAFIAIVMTGLDQDMMQKNLTCRNLKDAQKNMFWFTIVLTIVNFIFLVLGLLLTVYAQQNGIDAHKDQLYPTLAMQNEFGIGIAVLFILGLIAAAYSSADSALTALTTSFSIDILEIEKKYDPAKQVRIRKLIHILISFVLILVIIIYRYVIADDSVISQVFKFAGFTYGPLLGLYAFGLFTKWKVKDRLVPVIAIVSVLLSIFINLASQIYVFLNQAVSWKEAEIIAADLYYQVGFEILIINGIITFVGLILIRTQKN